MATHLSVIAPGFISHLNVQQATAAHDYLAQYNRTGYGATIDVYSKSFANAKALLTAFIDGHLLVNSAICDGSFHVAKIPRDDAMTILVALSNSLELKY